MKLAAVIIQIYGIRKSKLDHEQVKQTNPYQKLLIGAKQQFNTRLQLEKQNKVDP